MADMPAPVATIVIPTHNRSALLRRMLDALAAQASGTPPFDVVIVADGCVDDTLEMLADYVAPFAFRVLERGGEGPAIARNAGAAAANADLLIFLDDDVEPTPGFVAAHVVAHEEEDGRVVLGPYPPVPHADRDFFRLKARAWWTDHFASLAQAGHRFSFRDLLTGNLSLSRALWEQAGGLDPQFARAREDLELGVRLLKANAHFHFVPDALGWHHEYETMTTASALRRAMEEGRSDLRMALKHPELDGHLKIVRLYRWPSRKERLVQRLIMPERGLFDPLLNGAARLLPVLQACRFHAGYNRLFGALQGYWYRRGGAEALREARRAGHPPLQRGGSAHAPPPSLEIDLSLGIEVAEAILSAQRPAAVRLKWGNNDIGLLPYAPAAEAWDGRHLRSVLAGRLAKPFLRALVKSGQGGTILPDGHGPSTRAIDMIGTLSLPQSLMEVQAQWRHIPVSEKHRP